jgi:HEPN domain-containing protein
LVLEAEVDLERAKRHYEWSDYSMTCFLSQQAVDKALKAIIIGFLREHSPHIYDLIVLYSRVKNILDLGEKAELLPEISQYYITARYPNAGLKRPSTSFSRIQAERALEVASYVLERVKEAITERRSS